VVSQGVIMAASSDLSLAMFDRDDVSPGTKVR
jgi:hypothetical protein